MNKSSLIAFLAGIAVTLCTGFVRPHAVQSPPDFGPTLSRDLLFAQELNILLPCPYMQARVDAVQEINDQYAAQQP